MNLAVIKQTTSSVLIFVGIVLMMLIGKVFPETAIDYWPWPLASIFLGIGIIVGQAVLTLFGAVFILAGVFTFIF